jgi:hypothetical protein
MSREVSGDPSKVLDDPVLDERGNVSHKDDFDDDVETK